MVRCRYTHRNSLELLRGTRRWLCYFHTFTRRNHKMQSSLTNVCVRVCIHHVHFSFLFLLVVGGVFCAAQFFPCASIVYACAPKMIGGEWKEPNIDCVYSCIYKDAIDPYFSTRFFLWLVFIRFDGSFLPNNGLTLNFQPFFLIPCLICFILSCCSSISHVVVPLLFVQNIVPCRQSLCFIINFGRQNRTEIKNNSARWWKSEKMRLTSIFIQHSRSPHTAIWNGFGKYFIHQKFIYSSLRYFGNLLFWRSLE